MNSKRIKQRWLLFSLSILIAGAISVASTGCSTSDQRSQESAKSRSNEGPDGVGQPSEVFIQPDSQKDTPESTSAGSSNESASTDDRGKQANYTIDGIQFSYAPTDIVVDTAVLSHSDEEVTLVQLWVPEDYQQVKSGSFKGDFPPNATISIHSNPQAFSLLDWIQLRPGFNKAQDIQERAISGQEGLSFTIRGLFQQTNIAFVHPQAEKIVLISLKQPNQENTEARYEEAFEAVLDSMTLVGS